MSLLKPDILRNHPVRSGLLWTALFIPLTVLLQAWIGAPVSLPGLAALVILAVPGGIAWGYAMRWIVRRRDHAG